MTVKDSYPIPRVDQTLHSLGGATLFSSLDLVGDNFLFNVAEKDRPKTAFATPFGLYQSRWMPLGLTNTPATFSHVMTKAPSGLVQDMALVYLDDAIVHSRDLKAHVERLKAVLSNALEMPG